MPAPAKSSWKQFFWNADDGTCCYRDGGSWVKIVVFYVVLYAFLALFFYACLAISLTFIPSDVPRLLGSDQIIVQQPGLGMRPQDGAEYHYFYNFAPPVYFKQSDATTYSSYVKSLKAMIDFHSTSGTVHPACGATTSTCNFDVSTLGPCNGSDPDFGFSSGKPCFLFKLNQIYDWAPLAYTADPNPEAFEDAYFKRTPYANDSVGVSCQPYAKNIDGSDLVNYPNSNMTFYPTNTSGFPFQCFPSCANKYTGYKSPLVAIQFDMQAFVDKRIHFWCRAWARNINNGHYKNHLAETGVVTTSDKLWYNSVKKDRGGSQRFRLCMYTDSKYTCVDKQWWENLF